MSSVNVLFYSNNCEGSKMLISLMQNEKLIRFFHLICTDAGNVPPQVTKTPTLIIRNVPTPYVASDCFVWFSKVKQWKINMMMQRMTTAQQQYLQSINSNLVSSNSNLLGFNSAEMNGMSDIFSFFSQNMAQECQEAFPQSFFTCNNLGKENIFTPPLEDGQYKINPTGKYKINTNKHKELEASIIAERSKQDKLFEQHIDNFKKQYNG